MTYAVVNFSTNASTLNIIQPAPFVTLPLFLLFVGVAVLALVLSHVSKRGQDFWAILAFIFSLVCMWSSMGLATFNDPILVSNLENATMVENTTITVTNYSTYYSVQALASPWLTLVMTLFVIIALLNIVFVYVETTAKAAEQAYPDTNIEVGYQQIGRYK